MTNKNLIRIILYFLLALLLFNLFNAFKLNQFMAIVSFVLVFHYCTKYEKK
jgi:hypothetical protein